MTKCLKNPITEFMQIGTKNGKGHGVSYFQYTRLAARLVAPIADRWPSAAQHARAQPKPRKMQPFRPRKSGPVATGRPKIKARGPMSSDKLQLFSSFFDQKNIVFFCSNRGY